MSDDAADGVVKAFDVCKDLGVGGCAAKLPELFIAALLQLLLQFDKCTDGRFRGLSQVINPNC